MVSGSCFCICGERTVVSYITYNCWSNIYSASKSMVDTFALVSKSGNCLGLIKLYDYYEIVYEWTLNDHNAADQWECSNCDKNVHLHLQ